MIGRGKPPNFLVEKPAALVVGEFYDQFSQEEKSLLRLCEFPNQWDKFHLIWIEIPGMFSAYSNNKNILLSMVVCHRY